jgi:hypothetical protein
MVNYQGLLTPIRLLYQLPTGVGGIHQQNADVASSMSAAPFAVGLGDGGKGGDDDDSSSSYRHTSDNGTEDNYSMSSSVHSDYDNNAENAGLPPDSDVNLAYLDGHHIDLFENMFQMLPVDDSKYRSPGTTSNGLSGPLLFPPRDDSSILSALLPHADDGVFLSQDLHDSAFELGSIT